MTRLRPSSTYRLLSIREEEYQHLVGRRITVQHAHPAANGMWQITGSIAGALGIFELTAAVEKDAATCYCPVLPFPHKRGKRCAEKA